MFDVTIDPRVWVYRLANRHGGIRWMETWGSTTPWPYPRLWDPKSLGKDRPVLVGWIQTGREPTTPLEEQHQAEEKTLV